MVGVKTVKIFLDASVLVAASASVTGASAYVLHLSRQKKIKTFVSPDVIGEATKNVNLKLGETGKHRLKTYLNLAHLVLVDNPKPELVALCESVIHVKDAPILAAALNAKVGILLSLDRKHFFTAKVIDYSKPMKILTPGDWLRSFR